MVNCLADTSPRRFASVFPELQMDREGHYVRRDYQMQEAVPNVPNYVGAVRISLRLSCC